MADIRPPKKITKCSEDAKMAKHLLLPFVYFYENTWSLFLWFQR